MNLNYKKQHCIGVDGTRIFDYLDRWAANYPDLEAIVDVNHRLTWAQYKKMVDRLALNFLELGIKKGDVVTAQLPNSVEFCCITMALSRIGAIMNPVVMPWRQFEIDYVLELTEPVVVIVPVEYNGFHYAKMMSELQGKHKSIKHLIVINTKEKPFEGCILFNDLWNNRLEEKYPEDYFKQFDISADDIITVCMSSGTEASPKGVPRTHNNWKTASRAYMLHWYYNINDVVLIVLPLANLFALQTGLFPNINTRQKLVILDGFDVEKVAKLIEQEKVTVFPGVPVMNLTLLNMPGIEKYDTSSLRLIVAGGAPTPPSILIQIMEKFKCDVVNGYGSSEGTWLATHVGQTVLETSETIGPDPIFYECKVLDDDGNEVPAGQMGELAFRGPGVVTHYYKRPDLDKKSFTKDGFFLSGDLGYLGEDGNYRFGTRKKDLIIRGGMNISPEEIENIVVKHPKVSNVAAVGMPDERMGEEVCIFVEKKEDATDLTLDEIKKFMEENGVAKYKWPRRIELIKALPRNPTGKVLKYTLRDELAKKLEIEKRK